jgi:hypothetical protein
VLLQKLTIFSLSILILSSLSWAQSTSITLGTSGSAVADELFRMAPAVGAASAAIQGQLSGNCDQVPPDILDLAQRMKALRESCSTLQQESGTDRPIIITDYSRPPGNMYFFNSQGVCQRTFETASWGQGKGNAAAREPMHCSAGGSHYSPAGLHVLTRHTGKKYGPNNSFGRMGAERQGSQSRATLIHGRHPGVNGTTHGCIGLSDQDFAALQDLEPLGAMEYSYFGDRQQGPNCARSNGYRPNGGLPTCNEIRFDGGGNPIDASGERGVAQ